MNENIDVSNLKEMVAILKDIREKLNAVSWGSFRGPVADPVPSWGRGPVADPAPSWGRGPVADPAPSWANMRGQMQETASSYINIRGPVADPIPFWIMDKSRLAKLKIRQIDLDIAERERQIDFLKLERDLLAEEYKVD
jgi:hypothetical protein